MAKFQISLFRTMQDDHADIIIEAESTSEAYEIAYKMLETENEIIWEKSNECYETGINEVLDLSTPSIEEK